MAQFKSQPIEIVTLPNFYSTLPDSQWVITHGQAVSLAAQLWISDALGARRYIIPTTAGLQVTFLRADTAAQISASQTVMKPGTINAQDRSIFTFNLTLADSQAVISGSVIFKLTDSVPTNPHGEWVQNYAVKKLMIGPGY